MKKLISFVLSLLVASILFTSCKGGSTSASLSKDSLALAERVDSIYRDVARFYGTNDVSDGAYLYKKFCTKDYLQQMYYCDTVCYDEGLIVIDYDEWVMAQEWEDFSAKVLKVDSVSASDALVTIEITNVGAKKLARISLKKEDGQWLIDDFRGCIEGEWDTSIREKIEQYKAENR